MSNLAFAYVAIYSMFIANPTGECGSIVTLLIVSSSLPTIMANCFFTSS